MPEIDGLSALARGAYLSPFTRTHRLLARVAAGHAKPINLTIGDPREAMPAFVPDRLGEAQALFATYPKIRASDDLRGAIAAWIGRRYGVAGEIDAAREILPVSGSREGLFFAAIPAAGRKRVAGQPVILIVNPFYQAYLGAAYATNCEPVFLNATAETGHLPDLDALETDSHLLARTVALYLCSPANPQGAVADAGFIRRALALARRHDFMLFFDECYSEIYTGDPPAGALAVALATPERFQNLVVFNSLSKRSNLPGLRSGFAAGDSAFLETLAEVRNMIAPTMPGPVQHVSAAVWSDEAHVAAIRAAYRAKFDICDQVLGGRFGYARPAGGFFLWLDMSHLGGAEEAALTIWQAGGVRVVPGAYLAEPDRAGVNPGRAYVRVALVEDAATVRQALERVVLVSA
ncbi:MAG: aminotransferase class I/II-fold pyridoxal phosphate-dependent enzyme [Hyphomonadaceae bacterium]|jgi:aspartate/methionine/tyrosine aminotransferase|nr:aminotransferase class I/II-fold pyridoxal phosphate-dependent enzyme [Hyphomonadaceae bacterium]